MTLTRKEYLTGFVSHRDYYAQFVTNETIAHIRQFFPRDVLAKALQKDIHLNSIPLESWDIITWEPLNSNEPQRRNTFGKFKSILPINRNAVEESHEKFVTRVFLTCVAKEAARQIVENKETHS